MSVLKQTRQLVRVNSRQSRYGELFKSAEAHMTPLIVAMRVEYGDEFLDWTPESIRLSVLEDFGVEIPVTNLNRIMAGISLLQSQDFYSDLPTFIRLCNVIADDSFDLSTFDIATCVEMAWAITEAMLLAPPEDEDNAFSKDIRYYIGEMATREGIINPPDVLGIALRDVELTDPLYMDTSDPVMYSAFWKLQSDRGTAIQETVKENLQELLQQIDTVLQGTNYNRDWLKAALAAKTRQPEPEELL